MTKFLAIFRIFLEDSVNTVVRRVVGTLFYHFPTVVPISYQRILIMTNMVANRSLVYTNILLEIMGLERYRSYTDENTAKFLACLLGCKRGGVESSTPFFP